MNDINVTRRKQPIGRQIGKSIVRRCCDGKWRSAGEIARRAGTSEVSAHSVLKTMCWRSRRYSYGARAEWKRVGKERHFRVFKQDKTVSVMS